MPYWIPNLLVAVAVDSASLHVAGTHVAQRGPAELAESALADRLGLCDQGDLDSCVKAGWLHMTGRTAHPDIVLAAQLFERACTGGVPKACANLGVLFERGQGEIAVDKAKARSYYDKACASGKFYPACNNLGQLLLSDAAHKSDDAALRAAELFRKACNAAVFESCRNLARMNISRLTPFMSPAAGWAIYQQACSDGDAESCKALAAKRDPRPQKP